MLGPRGGGKAGLPHVSVRFKHVYQVCVCMCVCVCVQVAACCSVRHGRPMMIDTLFTVLFVFVLLLFACVVVVIMASKNVSV